MTEAPSIEELVLLALHPSRAWLREQVILQTHLNSPEGARIEPSPHPWITAVFALFGAVRLRDVAAKMPEGEPKRELGKTIDAAVSRFIDSHCGNGATLGPPPPPVYLTASLLAGVANSLHEGGVRNELLEVAGRIVQISPGSVVRKRVRLPSDAEIDAMAFPSSDNDSDNECEVLCEDFLTIAEELQGATGRQARVLLARLRANAGQRRALHCKLCAAPSDWTGRVSFRSLIRGGCLGM
jgi:hypothetical protein